MIMEVIGEIKQIERAADNRISEWQSNVALLTVNAHINYIKSNFKVLLDDNDDMIKNIFEGL